MTREEALKIWLPVILMGVEKMPECKDALEMAIKALEQELCEDSISRSSLKKKLQEHHDFFVNAYGGFSNLPPNDKARVDEITHCIAEVVNMPSVKQEPKTGQWIYKNEKWHCSECGETPKTLGYVGDADFMREHFKFCNHCGCRMNEVRE